MVYIRSVIIDLKQKLIDEQNIQSFCYLYLFNKTYLSSLPVLLEGEEAIAAKGFKDDSVRHDEVDQILKRRSLKGLDYSSNIFKLLGLYLASPESFSKKLEEKYNKSSLKHKYLIAKCVPIYKSKLKNDLEAEEDTNLLKIVEFIFKENGDISNTIKEFISNDLDVIDLIILEDVEQVLLNFETRGNYILNIDGKAIVGQILYNFRNAANKIIQDRRAGHNSFKIDDEYDVQDLLYVMLKPVFPSLKEEDPTPRVGVKSNRIDLIIREESILIEVKMIKQSDINEKHFVEQLKTDIQSYYQCQWLKNLICFIYDPQSKTKDRQNFYDLNGDQEIKGIRFNVDVIVIS